MEILGKVSTSSWKSAKSINLERKSLTFKLAGCKKCGHCFLSGNFTPEVFEYLYKPNSKEFAPQVVTENPQINTDIINSTKKYFKESSMTIIDFGCGDLELLKQVQSVTKDYTKNLIGIDFAYLNPEIGKDIIYLRGDLSNLEKIQKLKNLKFDFGYLVHTLEHLPDPKKVLLNIRAMMHMESLLYIEVPANDILQKVNLTALDLIAAQHIQYFTEDSLSVLVNLLGFSIVKKEKKITNNIPRLKMIIKRKDLLGQIDNLKNSNLRIAKILKDASQEILKKSLKNKKIGIWGIGSDLYSMIAINPKLKKEILKNKVFFIDSYLEKKYFLGKRIHNLQEANKHVDAIVLSPLPGHVRKNMLTFAQNNALNLNKIFDPYKK